MLAFITSHRTKARGKKEYDIVFPALFSRLYRVCFLAKRFIYAKQPQAMKPGGIGCLNEEGRKVLYKFLSFSFSPSAPILHAQINSRH